MNIRTLIRWSGVALLGTNQNVIIDVSH